MHFKVFLCNIFSHNCKLSIQFFLIFFGCYVTPFQSISCTWPLSEEWFCFLSHITLSYHYSSILRFRKKKIQQRPEIELDRSNLTFGWSINVHWNGLSGKVAVNKSFLRKRKREKRLRHPKLHRTVNQWQQVWRRDES